MGLAEPIAEEAFKPTEGIETEEKRDNCGIIPQKEENELDRLKKHRDELEASLRQAQNDAKLRLKKEKKNATKKRKK